MQISRINFAKAQNFGMAKGSVYETAKQNQEIWCADCSPGSDTWITHKLALRNILNDQLENDKNLTATERKDLEKDKFLVEHDIFKKLNNRFLGRK